MRATTTAFHLLQGTLERNAGGQERGAGPYFTSRPLIQAMVDVMQPHIGNEAARRPTPLMARCLGGASSRPRLRVARISRGRRASLRTPPAARVDHLDDLAECRLAPGAVDQDLALDHRLPTLLAGSDWA
jgi:hypothetical protein